MFAIRTLLATSLLLISSQARAAEPVVIALGDSITRGERTGVKAEETFSLLLAEKTKAKVVNAGIGGERTDGGLARLEKLLATHKPAVVLVMYGTNDSYVDVGKKEPRITADQYRDNLVKIVDAVRKAGAEPVLMTEPRWAPGATNGAGEDPNERLEKYLDVCRVVAKDKTLKLVDHYAHWKKAEADGTKIRDWTTDGCHPNPRGHKELADLILPVLADALKAEPKK